MKETSRLALLVEPPKFLDFFDGPFLVALPGKNLGPNQHCMRHAETGNEHKKSFRYIMQKEVEQHQPQTKECQASKWKTGN